MRAPLLLSLALSTLLSLACGSSSSNDGGGGGTAGGSGGTGGGGGGGAAGGTAGGSSGGSGGGGSSLCHSGLIDVTTDATWSGSVTVDCDVFVRDGATLTVAAGAAVHVNGGKGFRVFGSIKVEGTTASPVTISPSVAGTPWGKLQLESSSSTRVLSLKNVTLSGGGDTASVQTSSTMGALVFNAGATSLYVENVTVKDASGIGVVMQQAPFAPGSTNLTVQGSGSYPLFIPAQWIGSVPTGSYATNAKPELLIESAWIGPFSGDTRVTTDSTIKKLDVPYRFGVGAFKSDLRLNTVQSGPPNLVVTPPLVTIEAGVELRFSKVTTSSSAAQSQVMIDYASITGGTRDKALGAIHAVGTTAAPIVFTSGETTPAAGDWGGLAFSDLDARTLLDHVVIAYAGADSRTIGACATGSPTTGGRSPNDGDAALQLLFNKAGPTASILTNSTIHDSAGGAVYRGWRDVDVDFTTSNTFTSIAWCRQTPVILSSVCVPLVCN